MRTRRLVRSAGAIALLALVGASDTDPRAYETEYVITTTVTDDGGGQARPMKRGGNAPAHVVKREGDLFRQKLGFARLAIADVALTAVENAKELVPAGEQYFKAATNGPELWCMANMKMPQGAFARDVIGRVYSQYCILDADRDGVFESFFRRARSIEVLPNVRGKITPNPRAIRPLRLRQVDPATLRTNYFIGIAFTGARGKNKSLPTFDVFAGSEFGRFWVESGTEGTAEASQRLTLDGAVIEVTRSPAGFSGKVIRPFPARPQRIRGTNCGMINGC